MMHLFMAHELTTSAKWAVNRVYISSLRKKVVKRDVRFEEDKALRKAHDTGATTIGDQQLETQKIEETHGASTGAATDD
jgi:hypothetical protein